MRHLCAAALILATLIGFEPSATAQVSSKIFTASVNEAKATARSSETKQIAANTDVTAGRSITANGRTISIGGTGYNKVTVRITGGSGKCSLETFGGNDNLVCAGIFSASISGKGDVRFSLKSAGGAVDGTLRVTSALDTVGVFALGSTSVDVGDDASAEFTSRTQNGTEVWSTPLRLDATETKIRIQTSALAFSCASAASTSIVAEFFAVSGSVRRVAPACATGPALTAEHHDWRPKSGTALETLEFTPTTPPAGGWAAVYAFGTKTLQVPVLPTGCLVRNDVLVLVPVAANNPALSVAIPSGAKPASACVQFALATKSLSGADLWQTSDSLLVQVK